MSRLWPAVGVLALELLSVTSRTAGWSRRTLWLGIEVAPRAQPNQMLRAMPFEPVLKLDGVVAGAEDEKRRRTLLAPIQPLKQGPHLPCGYLGVVLGRMQTPKIYRGDPAIPLEAQLGNELVNSPSDDGLPRRMATGRMIL
jgi:hypothetical protein